MDRWASAMVFQTHNLCVNIYVGDNGGRGRGCCYTHLPICANPMNMWKPSIPTTSPVIGCLLKELHFTLYMLMWEMEGFVSEPDPIDCEITIEWAVCCFFFVGLSDTSTNHNGNVCYCTYDDCA